MIINNNNIMSDYNTSLQFIRTQITKMQNSINRAKMTIYGDKNRQQKMDETIEYYTEHLIEFEKFEKLLNKFHRLCD